MSTLHAPPTPPTDAAPTHQLHPPTSTTATQAEIVGQTASSATETARLINNSEEMAANADADVDMADADEDVKYPTTLSTAASTFTEPVPAKTENSSHAISPAKPTYAAPSARPYSEAFEKELMNLLLHGTTPPPDTSALPQTNGNASPAPISLSSSARNVESSSRVLRDLRVKLTEERGSILGGPGPGRTKPPQTQPQTNGAHRNDIINSKDNDDDGNGSHDPSAIQQLAFLHSFLSSRPEIRSPAQAREAIETEIEFKIEEAKERYRRREHAIKQNDMIIEQIREMEEQRRVERRVWEMMRKGGV